MFLGCEGEADVIFIIENSNSISSSAFSSVKAQMVRMVRDMDISTTKTRVGVISATNNGVWEFELDDRTNINSVVISINSIPHRNNQGTSFNNIFTLAKNTLIDSENGARQGIPDIIFLISTTAMNIGGDEVADNALDARGKQVVIMALIVGSNFNQDAIMKLATDPYEKNSWFDIQWSGLNSIYNSLMTRFCQEIPACAGEADITFVLDSSGSVPIWDWEKLLDFTKRVVSEMYISQNGVRIAAISFSTQIKKEFYLNEHYTKTALYNAIDKIEYLEQLTNTAGALRALYVGNRDAIYDTNKGNRLNVRDLVIVVTDGASSDQAATEIEAKRIHERGLRTFAIGIGPEVNQDELRNLASNPDSTHYFQLKEFDTLKSIEKNLVEVTCKEAPPDCKNKQLDVIFMIDTSGSIELRDFKRILNFVRELASRLDVDSGQARIGVLTFSDSPHLVFHLNKYNNIQEITREIVNIKYSYGGTNTHLALRYVRETMFSSANGDRTSASNIVLLITDGASREPQLTIDEARKTRASGVDIIALGIGKWIRKSEIQMMASYPRSRNHLLVPAYTELFAYSNGIIAIICDVVNECNPDPCKNGGQCVDSLQTFYCKCPSGFTGRTCEDQCLHSVDIVFLIDASGSIQKENFPTIEDFVRDMIQGLDINGGRSRVGVMTFATATDIHFQLGDYTDTKRMLEALSLRFTGGTTNTAEALRVARQNMFTRLNGDRDDALNVIILLTDGKSNNRDDSWEEATATRKAGIHIITIGIGGSVEEDELFGIASHPTEANVKVLTDYASLSGQVSNILLSACNSK